MSGDWYDTYPVTSRKNIARMLQGSTVSVDGSSMDEPDLELWVESVGEVIVGIDSEGVFAGLEILASVGPFLEGACPLQKWTLLSGGLVEDSDACPVGRHRLATNPGLPSVLSGARSQGDGTTTPEPHKHVGDANPEEGEDPCAHDCGNIATTWHADGRLLCRPCYDAETYNTDGRPGCRTCAPTPVVH